MKCGKQYRPYCCSLAAVNQLYFGLCQEILPKIRSRQQWVSFQTACLLTDHRSKISLPWRKTGTSTCSHALLPNSPSLWADSWKGGSLCWGHDTSRSRTAYAISPQPPHVCRVESDLEVLALLRGRHYFFFLWGYLFIFDCTVLWFFLLKPSATGYWSKFLTKQIYLDKTPAS